MSEPKPRNMPMNSLAQFMELWLEALESQRCSNHTIINYRKMVGRFIRFLNESRPNCKPEDVTAPDIRRWLIFRRTVGSTHTLHNEFRNPRAFWNWMLREELTENNPFAKVVPPRRDKVIKKDLSMDEVKALLAACSGKTWFDLRDRALITLLLDTGLRIHEAHNLRPNDIEEDTLVIRGKGGKHRHVFLSGDVRLSLHRYIRAYPKGMAADGPLWWGYAGALTLDGLKQAVRSTGERAGIQPLGPHRLRRTFATWSLRSGCDIETLRRLMGHSSLSVLQGYLALVETDLKKAHTEHSPMRMVDLTESRRNARS